MNVNLIISQRQGWSWQKCAYFSFPNKCVLIHNICMDTFFFSASLSAWHNFSRSLPTSILPFRTEFKCPLSESYHGISRCSRNTQVFIVLLMWITIPWLYLCPSVLWPHREDPNQWQGISWHVISFHAGYTFSELHGLQNRMKPLLGDVLLQVGCRHLNQWMILFSLQAKTCCSKQWAVAGRRYWYSPFICTNECLPLSIVLWPLCYEKYSTCWPLEYLLPKKRALALASNDVNCNPHGMLFLFTLNIL